MPPNYFISRYENSNQSYNIIDAYYDKNLWRKQLLEWSADTEILLGLHNKIFSLLSLLDLISVFRIDMT